jgi:protein CWC15
VKKRDLRTELLAAEADARNKKRKAEGKPPLEDSAPRGLIESAKPTNGDVGEEDEASKRRKLLQEALEMDKDDDDENDDVDEDANNKSDKEGAPENNEERSVF